MLGVLKMSIATLEGELAKVKSREQAKTATLTKEIALLQYTCEEHSSSVQVTLQAQHATRSASPTGRSSRPRPATQCASILGCLPPSVLAAAASASVQVWAGEARRAAAESSAAIEARLASTEARVATVSARAVQLAATLSKRRAQEMAEREREAAEREVAEQARAAEVLRERAEAAEAAEASLAAAEEARAALSEECRGLRTSLAEVRVEGAVVAEAQHIGLQCLTHGVAGSNTHGCR